MAKIAGVQEVSRADLRPYERNAKKHSAEQVDKIARSIKEFGFLSPCLIDRDLNIIAGHGRVMAAEQLGLETVPCVFVEGLTEEQRRAYILADNRLTELGGWDESVILDELFELDAEGFDIELTGFDMLNGTTDWFETRDRNDTSREDGNDEYNEFLDKFETKKTTDDCYTPDVVYEAVANWVAEEYGVKRENFVRPFYPGGDYQAEKYATSAIVVDNPPFSILSEILRFYDENGIKFFLFAPTLTLFSSSSSSSCALCCGVAVLYENGASVNTSFLTNLENGRFRSCPELYKRVSDAVDTYRAEQKAELPKYNYPHEVVLSTGIAYLSKYGQDFRVSKDESVHIRQLDSQKEYDKAMYGSGYLISERAAAERATAEQAAAEQAVEGQAIPKIWTLSEREKEIVKNLGGES